MLRQRLSRKLALGLAMVAVALVSTACFSVSQGDGQIGLTTYAGFPAAQFTLKSSLSNALAQTGYQQACNNSVSCTINLAYGSSGNDVIANEAIADCNPTDPGTYDPINGQVEICGYDFDQALWNRNLTCPGGPFCNSGYFDWQSRCLAFVVSNGGALNELLNWNLNGAYFVYGSWTWYRQGNGNCQS